MDPGLKELLLRRPPLPKVFKNQILHHGIKTGSKIFGGYIKGISDIDFILPPKFNPSFSRLVDERYGVYIAEYEEGLYQSLYVRFSNTNTPINLLYMVSKKEYKVWRRATLLMSIIISESENFSRLVLNKKPRIELFGCLKAIAEYQIEKQLQEKEQR